MTQLIGKHVIKFNKDDPKYGYMSNFYNCDIFFYKKYWPSAETLYQASKTNDTKWRECIRRSVTNYVAGEIAEYVPIREDWERVKIGVMYDILLAKFGQNQHLRDKLLSTGSQEIMEQPPREYCWGCSMDGEGHEILGNLLMKVRESLRT